MKCFAAVLLLALFAVAMADEARPKIEAGKVDVTKEAPVNEAARDKRGIVEPAAYTAPVNEAARDKRGIVVPAAYAAPIAYSAYTPYAYSGYLHPYAAYPYLRYSYPYYSIYG